VRVSNGRACIGIRKGIAPGAQTERPGVTAWEETTVSPAARGMLRRTRQPGFSRRLSNLTNIARAHTKWHTEFSRILLLARGQRGAVCGSKRRFAIDRANGGASITRPE
jgi:hypothetical protein